MRNGFLGILAAWIGIAAPAWGQFPPTGPFPAQFREAAEAESSGLIPTQGPGATPIVPPNFGGGNEPYTGIGYPPPGNMAAFDPNGNPDTVYQPRFFQGSRAPLVWTNAEFLLWFARSMTFRYPLVTTSAPTDQGILGRGSTSVLFTKNDVTFNQIAGGRFSFGYFRDQERRLGFELSAFVMEKSSKAFEVFSQDTGGPVIARPFINLESGEQDALVISSPGVAFGGVIIDVNTRTYGAELNMVFNFYRSAPEGIWGGNVVLLAGPRFLSIEEGVEITSRTTTLDQTGIVNNINGQPIQGNFSTLVRDHIRTFNRFYGGQVGLSAELRYNRYVVGLTGKLALGNMHQVLQAQGETIYDTNAGIIPSQGGLSALNANIGKFRNDEFTAITEATLTFGYQFTPWLAGTIGGNMLYVPSIIRPGNVLNGQADPNFIPSLPNFGGNAPGNQAQQLFPQSNFWLLGVNFGLAIRF